MTKKITIKRTYDESFSVSIGEKNLGSFNHDQHGWDGMEAVESIIEGIATELNIEIEDIYSEDEE